MIQAALFVAATLIAVEARAQDAASPAAASPTKTSIYKKTKQADLEMEGKSTVNPLKPGDHARTLQVDGRTRSYIIHVPEARSQAADAGRVGLPWGGDECFDHGPLHRPQRKGR